MNFVIRKGGAEFVSEQIARQIEDAVRSGKFKPGERLPSVRKLKRELGVAFNTVLRAYRILQRTGLAYSIPGEGVYVSPDAPPPSDPEPLEKERVHYLALADAFIAQAERYGVDIDDALSEVKLRARIKGKKADAKEMERVVKKEIRDAAMKAEEEEKAKRKGGRGGKA